MTAQRLVLATHEDARKPRPWEARLVSFLAAAHARRAFLRAGMGSDPTPSQTPALLFLCAIRKEGPPRRGAGGFPRCQECVFFSIFPLQHSAADPPPRHHIFLISTMELKVISVDKPGDMNFILGQAHFIKTVEDIYEAVVTANAKIEFGLAFCEASGPALVRYAGNKTSLIELATKNAAALGCGHSFILFLEGGFPINILNQIKDLAEVCTIHCATANPVQVIVAETEQGRGILGVIDGVSPKGIETDADITARKSFLRAIGYKQS
jgi:adenosine/AMP kinase